jgi:arylsulfatase A-like enzyme
MRASLYKVLGPCILAALGLGGCGGTAGPPSLLLIVIEGMRADHSSAYGYSRSTTPGLEALAHEGVLFERAYTSTPHPLAAMASLLSGRYPPEHGMLLRSGLDPALPTLAQVVAGSGYETCAVVSDPLIVSETGLLRGFEEIQMVDPADAEDLDGGAAEATRRARRWLEEGRDGSRPFFLMVVYSSPRLPFDPPEPHRGRFLRGDEGREAVQRAAGIWLPFTRRFNAGQADLGPEELDLLKSLYDAELAHADEQLRDLLGGMRERGLLDRTLLVVTSERGQDLGEGHRLSDRTSLSEASLRVPLLMRLPGRLPAGRRVTDLAQDVDILPTVAGLLDLEKPATITMTAVDHFLEGGKARRGAVSVAVRQLPNRILDLVMSATDGRHRYQIAPQGPEALIDLSSPAADPTDLLEAEPGIREDLHGVLMEWDGSLRPIPGSGPPPSPAAGLPEPGAGGESSPEPGGAR